MAGTRIVRIDRPTEAKLRELVKETGEPRPAILRKAVEELRRKLFLEAANAEFSALRKNAKLWKAELKERSLWERTLADGSDDEDALCR